MINLKIHSIFVSNNFNVLLFILFFSTGLITCQNKKVSIVGSLQSNEISGIWISEEFLSKLLETKNSNLSSNNIKLSLVEFKNKNKCTIIWNFYEGTEFDFSNINDSVLLINKTSRNIFNNIFFTKNQDTLFDNNHNKYVKIENDKILENYIFEGKYKDLTTNFEVIFHKDGKISGLKNFSYYSFEIQNTLRDSSLNIIYLNDNKYVYRFINKTILDIYTLNCQDISDDETCVIGKKIVSLERK